jgi:hypothetical protein
MQMPANKLELWFALEAERFAVPVLRYALHQRGCLITRHGTLPCCLLLSTLHPSATHATATADIELRPVSRTCRNALQMAFNCTAVRVLQGAVH